jgi:hypothetical protein
MIVIVGAVLSSLMLSSLISGTFIDVPSTLDLYSLQDIHDHL